MINGNESTSIETLSKSELSHDELSLVSGGCYGHSYKGYGSWGGGGATQFAQGPRPRRATARPTRHRACATGA